MLDLGGADAERQRAEGAVRGGVGVAADHGGAGLGQAQLRAHDVDDALLDVAQRVQPHAELGAVLAQRLQLRARDRVGDGLVDVEGRGVVILGRDGEVEAPHLAAGLAEAVEGLRAGHLVQQVQIDEEEVGLAFGAPDDVVVPDLLRECPTHRFPSDRPCCAGPTRECGGPRPYPSCRTWTAIRWSADRPSQGGGFHRKIELAFHRVRREYRRMDNSSGVGVLDKAALVLSALESGPATLAGLVAATGLARPTAHRLAVALEHHRMVARDMQGRFILGPRLAELAAAAGEDRLLATAGPVLTHLRDVTGESAQLYRRQGDMRICVAAAERLSGLRDTVPVGSTLTMKAGSSAQILMAWEEPERLHRGLQGARFTATALSGVRRRGWAQSIGEREPGVASVSAPVRGPSNRVVAAVSVSGPIERLTRHPGRMHAQAIIDAAGRLSEALRRTAAEPAPTPARDSTRARRGRLNAAAAPSRRFPCPQAACTSSRSAAAALPAAPDRHDAGGLAQAERRHVDVDRLVSAGRAPRTSRARSPTLPRPSASGG